MTERSGLRAALCAALLGVLLVGGGLGLSRLAYADEGPAGGSPQAPAEKPATPDASEPELEGEALKEHKKQVKALVSELDDSKNRESVRHHIERMGASGTRAERDALMEFAATNKNHEFVEAAFVALSKIGHRKAIEFLCSKDALRNKSFLIAQSAAEALGTSRNPLAAHDLVNVMRDRRTKIEVVGACAIAAAQCAPTEERVIEAVLEFSQHRKDTIRSCALEAVGYLGSDVAVARLTEALFEDKLARARAAAATGLGWTYRADAIPALERAIREDNSLHVQKAASDAIKTIRGGKRGS